MGSFGDRMRREREMRGIKLEEITESTKISRRHLLAIEEEHFDRLPGGIFNKGFVRAYARFLGLDEEQAVQDFMTASADYDQPLALQPPGFESSIKPPIMPSEASERRKDLGWALVALLVLAVGLFGWYKINHSGKNDAVSAQSSNAPATLPQIPLPNSVTEPVSPSGTSPELKRQSDIQAAGQAVVLAIRANRETWVSMVVDGKPYMDQVLIAGNERTVRARESIVLKTGNAGGLEVSYNGKPPVPVGKEGQVRTVTFTPEGMRQ
jgi:cytoskeletal protein RodZ